MKGWQNQYKIIQRVKRIENQVQDIINFENNSYLSNQSLQDCLDYNFLQSECFSLAQLIESMKCNFIKIYKGQVLIIILEVLKHIQQLHQKNMSHGRLNPQNIIIKIKDDKNNKLTIQQITFTIQQIYFINYRIIDDVQYQINYYQDIYDIINCCIQLISSYQNKLCELFNFIVHNLNLYKNNKKESDISKLVDFFNQQIKECVDLEKQKLKNIQIQPSKLIEQNIKVIQCQEGEEYGYLSKRYRNQTILSNQVEKYCNKSVIYELIQKTNSNEYDFDDQQVQIFDTANLNKEELQIFNVFEFIIKQQMMKIVWNHFGNYLESNDKDCDNQFIEILKIMNITNKEILNNHLFLFLKEYQNIKQINDEIKNEIEKNYKFIIVYDEQKAKDQFILELQIQAQNYDFNNIQNFINHVKSQVKLELQEYYYEVLEFEILKLINDLI